MAEQKAAESFARSMMIAIALIAVLAIVLSIVLFGR
jgi:hypothetical protein